MKELLELERGQAREQAKQLEQMAQSFMEKLQSLMGAEFQELGAALQLTSQAQASGAESGKALLEAVDALARSNRDMQENMAQMLKRQERLADDLEQQKRRLETACEEISRDVSNQLYTFGQMRALHDDEK